MISMPKNNYEQQMLELKQYSQDKELQSNLAQIRRKRLETAHKMILFEKLSEKQSRIDDVKRNNIERAHNSYHNGKKMRDTFFETVTATAAKHLP